MKARSAKRSLANARIKEAVSDRIEAELVEVSAIAGTVGNEGGLDTVFDDPVFQRDV